MSIIKIALQGNVFAIHRLCNRRNDALSVHFGDTMQVMVAASTRNNVGNLAVSYRTCEALIIMDVPTKDDIRLPPGAADSFVEGLFHVATARMVVIGGKYRVMHGHEKGLVGRGVLEF